MSLLLTNQAIMIPLMKNILLCSMQCSLNGVAVNEVLKFLLNNPVHDCMVIIPSDFIDSYHLIPLKIQGVTSYYPTWAATLSEDKGDIILKFCLAAEAPLWDPGS